MDTIGTKAIPHPQQREIEAQFTYHAPNEDQQRRLVTLREKAKELATLMLEVVPASADRSAALRKLREAVMTANAAIVLEGKA